MQRVVHICAFSFNLVITLLLRAAGRRTADTDILLRNSRNQAPRRDRFSDIRGILRKRVRRIHIDSNEDFFPAAQTRSTLPFDTARFFHQGVDRCGIRPGPRTAETSVPLVASDNL